MSMSLVLFIVVFSSLQCGHANGAEYCQVHDLKALSVNLRALRTEYHDDKVEKENKFKQFEKHLTDLSANITKLNEAIAKLEQKCNAVTSSCTTTTQAPTTAATTATKAQQTSTTTTTSTATPAATTTQATTTSQVTSEVPSSSCNEGWAVYNGSCYLVHDRSMNFTDAKSFCNNSGAHLINIGDGAENDFIKGVLSQLPVAIYGNYYWLGVSDEATEGVWIWEGTGLEVAFTAWLPGEPNSGPSGNCAWMSRFHSFQWLDTSCSDICLPICERRPETKQSEHKDESTNLPIM